MKAFKILSILGIITFSLAACSAPAPSVPPTSAPVGTQPTAATAVPQATQAPAATTAPGTSSPKKGGTLRVAFSEWPKNLDTSLDSGTEGNYVQANLTDGLLNIDINGKVIPGLATEMPERPDGVTYIFRLRKNVKFHNGEDFSADDVVFTFDRLLGKFPDMASVQAPRFKGIIKSVEALDKYTVKFTLLAPFDDLTMMIASDKYLDIVNKKAIQQLGADYGQKGATGTGPFKFKEWVKGDHITLVRNDNYWGDPPYLDAITYRAIPEDATRLIAFRTGEIDLMFDPPLKDVKGMANDSKVQIKSCDSGDLKNFFVNTSKPPFDDKKVRQALFYAIDRKAIMDTVYYGYGVIGQGIFPSWHWAYDSNANYFPYSPDKAKQLLAEAGYSDAKPLSFEILATDASEYVDTSTLIQAQLAKIGVKVTITTLDKAAWTAKVFQIKQKPNPGYQAAVYRLKFSDITTDLSWRIYHSKGSVNQTGYNQEGGFQHPEVEKMLDDAMVMTDRQQAAKVYQEISRLITEDATIHVLGWGKIVNLANSNVKGLGCWVRNDWPMRELWLDK